MTGADPLTAYLEATGREARLRIEADKAAGERAKSLAKMHRSGMSYAQIAADVRLSRSRVQQLVERNRSEQRKS